MKEITFKKILKPKEYVEDILSMERPEIKNYKDMEMILTYLIYENDCLLNFAEAEFFEVIKDAYGKRYKKDKLYPLIKRMFQKYNNGELEPLPDRNIVIGFSQSDIDNIASVGKEFQNIYAAIIILSKINYVDSGNYSFKYCGDIFKIANKTSKGNLKEKLISLYKLKENGLIDIINFENTNKKTYMVLIKPTCVDIEEENVIEFENFNHVGDTISNYIDGDKRKIMYCKDCGRKLSKRNGYHQRCEPCSTKRRYMLKRLRYRENKRKELLEKK